jgi:hypothetical protein
MLGTGSGGTVTDGTGAGGSFTWGTGSGTVIVVFGRGVFGSGPEDAWLATGSRASDAISPTPVAAAKSTRAPAWPGHI